MKRLAAVFFILLISLLLICPVFADVAYMPEDRFFERHQEECRYNDSVYWTNGPDGYVLAMSSPKSSSGEPIPNITRVRASYSWEDWLLISYRSEKNGWTDAWVERNSLVEDYGSNSFYLEHHPEIHNVDLDLTIGYSDIIYVYKYPGSGEVVDELNGDWASGRLNINQVFTDPEGRDWAYISYFYGHRDMWFCLDALGDDELPKDENCVTFLSEDPAASEHKEVIPGRIVSLTPPAGADTLTEAAKKASGLSPYLFSGGISVVILAAVLLVYFIRRKQHG